MAPRTTARNAAEATPAPKKAPPNKSAQTVHKASKAGRVRAFLQKNPDARPTDVAKATGVPASYVWDIRAAMQKKAAASDASATTSRKVGLK